MLAEAPLPVHRIADAFSISRPAISRHLRVLKQAGLVAEVKKGRENLYALKPARLSRATDWLSGFAAGTDRSDTGAGQGVAPAIPPADPKPPAEAVETRAFDQAPILPPELPQPEVTETADIADTISTRRQPAARPKKVEPASQMGFDF